MSIKEEAARERQKLKNMSGKDRLWYIWEYYKIHIAAVAVFICLISVVGNSLYRQSFTTRLSFCVINDKSGDTSHFDQLEDGLRQVLGLGKKDLIEINSGLYASYDGAGSQYSYATMAKISALVAGKDLDVMIADRESIDHYGSAGVFLDLEELLPPDLYQAVQGDLYTVRTEEGAKIPAAVSLERSVFHDETGVTMEPAYLAVVGSSPRTEAAVQMIRYLFP